MDIIRWARQKIFKTRKKVKGRKEGTDGGGSASAGLVVMITYDDDVILK